jgi:cation transport protein ChaC
LTDGTFRLTRDALAAGLLQRMIAEHAPDMPLLTDEERARSLTDTLAARPDDAGSDGGVWLFAYGSLIWNPAIMYDTRRRASVVGWHRAFCLTTTHGRGTPDNPGLLLGLDLGGRCDGVAFRIAAEHICDELSLLWRREMLAGAYIPRWVPLLDDEDVPFAHGIAFTIDTASVNYCGSAVSNDERVRRLATAEGMLGSSADYLFNTRDSLRALGIRDPNLDNIAEQVERLQQDEKLR